MFWRFILGDTVYLYRALRAQKVKTMSELKSIKKAAEELGVTPSALYQALRRGTLQAKVVGGVYILTPEQIEKYRESHLGKKSAGRPRKGDRK